MKILFIIQGEGRGHLTQALSLRQMLQSESHEVVGAMVGKNPPRRLPDFFWHKMKVPIYTFKRGMDPELRIDDTLSFHILHDQLFVRYMAGAKAYATTAGFESVCEAMFLNKPVLMVPTHIEQACNAHDASLSGAGVISKDFNLDSLLSIAHQPVEHTVFRHWVRQAEWLILREFRQDLLEENRPTSRWERYAQASLLRQA